MFVNREHIFTTVVEYFYYDVNKRLNVMLIWKIWIYIVRPNKSFHCLYSYSSDVVEFLYFVDMLFTLIYYKMKIFLNKSLEKIWKSLFLIDMSTSDRVGVFLMISWNFIYLIFDDLISFWTTLLKNFINRVFIIEIVSLLCFIKLLQYLQNKIIFS